MIKIAVANLKKQICSRLTTANQGGQKNRSRFWLQFFSTMFSTSATRCYVPLFDVFYKFHINMTYFSNRPREYNDKFECHCNLLLFVVIACVR